MQTIKCPCTKLYSVITDIMILYSKILCSWQDMVWSFLLKIHTWDVAYIIRSHKWDRSALAPHTATRDTIVSSHNLGKPGGPSCSLPYMASLSAGGNALPSIPGGGRGWHCLANHWQRGSSSWWLPMHHQLMPARQRLAMPCQFWSWEQLVISETRK